MTATAPTSAAVSAAAHARTQAQLVALARIDAATFIEYVMRDERTGAPIVLAPMHEEWHRLIHQHPRLVVHGFVESGKSSAVTVARTLFELGRYPAQRVAILSNTASQAQKLLGAVARYITTSPELAQVFPALRAATPWGSSAITVQRSIISKDASVQAIGVHGAVLGSRLDLVIVDDVLDFENTRTHEQRQQLAQWFDSTVLGRVVDSGRVLVLGSAWHPEDLMHVLKQRPGWHSVRYAVEDEAGRPRWPQRWPASRVVAKRQELGPLEAARQLDCLARDEQSSRFREEWIADSVKRGFGRPMLGYLLSCPAPASVSVGVDLAVSTRPGADLTAISVVLSREHGGNARRELLSVESGRWDAPEIIRRIIAVHTRYLPSVVVVESVAAQAYISQMLRGLASVPVRDFKTGRGKMSLQWQAEALAVEMSRGQWTLLGSDTSEVAALVRDLMFYSPTMHTGDRLVSLLLARWGAEQAGLRIEYPAVDFSRR
jgi:hypothetical protein